MVNHSLSEMQIVAMKPTRIVRRRRELQAYYGSPRSNGSRLPFLLEPPATATAFASMVSSWKPVAALRKATGSRLTAVAAEFTAHIKRIAFFTRTEMRPFTGREMFSMKGGFHTPLNCGLPYVLPHFFCYVR
jgi:hypothetical protein